MNVLPSPFVVESEPPREACPRGETESVSAKSSGVFRRYTYMYAAL